jgi:hypothetical protein
MTPAEDCIVVKPYGTSSDGESDDTRDPRCAGFNSAIVSAFEQCPARCLQLAGKKGFHDSEVLVLTLVLGIFLGFVDS